MFLSIIPWAPRVAISIFKVDPRISMVCKRRLKITLINLSTFFYIDPEVITIRSNTPGPGTYDDILCMSKRGQSPISTVSNSRAANWSPSKVRFGPDNMSMRDTPGPG